MTELKCITSPFSSMVFRLKLDQFACCVSRDNKRCKKSVPRSPLYMSWDLTLTSYIINSLPVSCSTNKPLKTWLGKPKFFAYINS